MDQGAILLWPEVEDLYTLMRLRVQCGHTAFEREKQNSPINPELCEWPESYFDETIWFDDWPTNLVVKTMALDPSKGSDARLSDYSATVTLGMDRHGILYVEADLARRTTPDIVAHAADWFRRFQPDAFAVESNQFQDLLAGQFESEFRRQGILAARPVPIDNQTSKQVRIRRLGSYLASRRFRFKANSPTTRLLVEQLQEFPLADHDDGPDALEMAIRLAGQILQGRSFNDGLGNRLPLSSLYQPGISFEVAHFFMRIPREKPGLAQQMTPHFVTVGVPILEIPAKINVRDLKNAQLQKAQARVSLYSVLAYIRVGIP